MNLIDRLRRSYVDHGTNYVQEAADALERLAREKHEAQDCLDAAKEEIERLTDENESLKRTDVLDLLQENEELREQLESLARTVMGDMGNQREPLTTDQINRLVDEVYTRNWHRAPSPEIIVRAVERAHGIGV